MFSFSKRGSKVGSEEAISLYLAYQVLRALSESREVMIFEFSFEFGPKEKRPKKYKPHRLVRRVCVKGRYEILIKGSDTRRGFEIDMPMVQDGKTEFWLPDPVPVGQIKISRIGSAPEGYSAQWELVQGLNYKVTVWKNRTSPRK